mmetsp:Transcript_37370/g.90831  ORF Transcript_37370/g.90831 Transcript_37370/m.90831 type:complete len:987 (-) Transcript_37370:55-3015(-)
MATTADVVVDPLKIRVLLRLIHSLQLERGSSCAFAAQTDPARTTTTTTAAALPSSPSPSPSCASSTTSGQNSISSSVFETAMMDARKATDAAVQAFHRLPVRPNEEKVHVDSQLKKIRALIENHTNGSSSSSSSKDNNDGGDDKDKTDDLTFHRIFVCFNTLISCIIHERVMKSLALSGAFVDELENDGGILHHQNFRPVIKPTIKKRHRRGLSSDINDKLLASTSEKILGLGSVTSTPTPKLKNTSQRKTFPVSMDGLMIDGDDKNGGGGRISSNMENPLSLDPRPSSSHPLTTDSCVEPPLPPPLPPPPAAATATVPSSAPNPSDDKELQKLLYLLHIFVQLKESAGVERAILSSILAFRFDADRSLPSVSMLINDLVLQVENQRSLVQQLERLPRGAHHDLVLDLAHLSPRLMDLQQIILTDFSSLQGAQYDAETIWRMITLYVDKLHSVELLILEDLECSLPCDIHSTGGMGKRSKSLQNLEMYANSDPMSTIKIALAAIADGSTVSSSDKIVAEFENLPAEEVKKRILELVSRSKDLIVGVEPEDDVLGVISETNSVKSETLAASGGTNQSNRFKQLHRAPSKEWQIEIYEIKFQKRLGQGASATTYLGQWTGQNVAIKVASITEFGQDGWKTEVNALQRLHHPNIIRMMGTIYNEHPQTQCLVLEYCNAGDLGTALRYPTPKNFFFHVSISIANAMTYLHSRRIIHRDLKPGNILCDGNVAGGQFTVKVTDFGIATTFDDEYGDEPEQSSDYTPLDLTGETGTYRWMAPECIRHEKYSYRCDVYSFAVMMWQLVSREEPFNNVGAVEAAELTALEGKRSPMPPLIPERVKSIIETNWDDDPMKRWDFGKMSQEIRSLRDSLSTDDLAYLEEPHGHGIQRLQGLFEGDNNEIARLSSGTNDSDKIHVRSGGRRRDSNSKRSMGRREKSWKSRNSRSPSRKPSPGRKPSLLSSFFGQRRKNTDQHQHSKSLSRASSRVSNGE